MQPEGVEVKAQPVKAAQIPAHTSKLGDNRMIYATVAYHYPHYSLKDVEEMAHRDVLLLIKTAQRIEAERMYNLTLIASAPQSKNGKGVKELTKYFKGIIDTNG